MTDSAPAPARSRAVDDGHGQPFSRTRFTWAVIAAAVANAVLFLAFSAAGGEMIVTQPAEQQLTVFVAIIATLAPLVLAGLVLWFLARRWPLLRPIAAWVGLAVAVLSAFSPAFVSSDTLTAVGLGLMHAVAGVAWFIGVAAKQAK